MSQLVAITFSREADGANALETIRGLERAGRIRLVDTAVVAKDPDGTVHRRDELSSGTEAGIAVGALLGAMLLAIFPLGIVAGAAVGGLVGGKLSPGLDEGFVAEVADDLRPGGSGLFLLIRQADMELLIAAMRRYRGTVRQTTLSSDDEAALEEALQTTP